MKPYRQGVVAVLVNDQKQVLVGERSDLPGVWQFPQGGIEDNETVEAAFFREVLEELGNNRCEILRIGDRKTRYDWVQPGRQYRGQEHTWFLARYFPDEEPNLEKSDACFAAWKWEDPARALSATIDWKRESMKQGLQMLGILPMDHK